jgi:ribosomal-protein-alanine N-acetyltransferase
MYNDAISIERGGYAMTENRSLCNQCGREIPTEHAGHTDALSVRKEWGYFSKWDLQIHEFTLCQKCYEQWIQNFAIPVAVSQKTEVLSEQRSSS